MCFAFKYFHFGYMIDFYLYVMISFPITFIGNIKIYLLPMSNIIYVYIYFYSSQHRVFTKLVCLKEN